MGARGHNDDRVDEWWSVAAEYIMDSGEEVCGRSTGKTK